MKTPKMQTNYKLSCMKKISTTCLFLYLTIGLHAQQAQWELISPMALISHVTALDDAVLIGTSGAGLVHWDSPDARTHINTSNSDISGDVISRVAIAPNGHWWVKTEAGISQFDGNNWYNWSLEAIGLPPNATVNNIRAAPDASVYVLTNEGFARFSGGVWSVQNTANSALPNNQLTDAAFGAEGKVFFGSRGSGILLLEEGNWTVFNSAATGVMNMNFISGLAFAPDGALWAIGGPLANLSIRLVSFAGNTWTGYTSASIGIIGDVVRFHAIVSDLVHGIWLSHSQGLSHLQGSNWTHYTSENIGCSPESSTSIALDVTGYVWFNSSCGLIRFNGQALNHVDTGLPGYCYGYKIEAVAEGVDGSLWLGANFSSCITRTDGIYWEYYNPLALGASNVNINTIFTDRQGRTWFGLDNSELLIYDQGQWTFTDTCAAVFPDHWIRTFAVSPGGDIWLAFVPLPGSSQSTAGIARYASGAWSFWTSTEVPNLQGRIVALESNEDGVLWVSVFESDGGLLRFDGSTWTLFNSSDSGLLSNYIYDITTAPDGTLWLGTDFGLAGYNGQDWSVTNIFNSDLPSNQITRLEFDHAGGLYVGYLPTAAGPNTAVLRDGQWTEIAPFSEPAFTEAPFAMIVDSRNRMIFTTIYAEHYYIYDPMLVSVADAPQQHTNWSVFPNPGTDAFYLRSALPYDRGYMSLYDMHGRRLMRMPLQDAYTPYQIERLPAGLYIIEVAVPGERAEYLRWVRH